MVTAEQHAEADGLQAVDRSASEGLQAIDARPHYSQYPVYSTVHGCGSFGEKADADQTPLDRGLGRPSRSGGIKGRKWIFGGSIAAVLLIIAVAVGVGVGVTDPGK